MKSVDGVRGSCRHTLCEESLQVIAELETEIEGLKKKYDHSIKVLSAIADRKAIEDGYVNEWTEAKAFRDCRTAARRCLEYLGEREKHGGVK